MRPLKYLISCGVDIQKYYVFLLEWACTNNYLDIIIFLLQSVGNIRIYSNDINNVCFYYDKAFIIASATNQLLIIKYLLKNGVDIHTNNNVALILASKKGYVDMVHFFN